MMDIQQAEENVVTLLAIIPKSFAIYGTALGIVRDGQIIEHDTDTDIGLFSDDFDWKIIDTAIKYGFTIISIYGTRHHGLEISLARNGIKTDIMILYRDNDIVWNGLWDDDGRTEVRHEYPADIMVVTEKRVQSGSHIKTLGEPYLRYVYGEKWRTPIKKWGELLY